MGGVRLQGVHLTLRSQTDRLLLHDAVLEVRSGQCVTVSGACTYACVCVGLWITYACMHAGACGGQWITHAPTWGPVDHICMHVGAYGSHMHARGGLWITILHLRC